MLILRPHSALGALTRSLIAPSARALSSPHDSAVVALENLPRAVSAPRYALPTEDGGVMRYYADTAAHGVHARPLVLVHGIHTVASAREMAPLFDAFRGERPVYALDLPGFGASDRYAESYTPMLYERAISAMLRRVYVAGGVDVVAQGLSAEFVARVAIEFPGLIHALVFISPTGFQQRSQMNHFEREKRNGIDAPSTRWHSLAGEYLLRLQMTGPSVRHHLRRSFYGPVDTRLYGYARSLASKPRMERALLAHLRGDLFPRGDSLGVYRQISAPTLIIYGDRAQKDYGNLDTFVQWNPTYRAQCIRDSRLFPQFEATAQVSEAMRCHFYRSASSSDESAASARHNPEATAHAPK